MRDKIYDKDRIVKFLKDLDDILGKEKIDRTVDIITVGGSAMSLLGFEHLSKDIDFFYKGVDYKTFSKALEKLNDRYNEKDIDFWEDGVMRIVKKGREITQKLSSDYFKISIEQSMPFKNIRVRTLNPIDLVLTKAARAEERDIDDIKILVEKYSITKEKLVERFKIYEDNFDGNIEMLKKKFKEVTEIVYNN